MGYFGRVVRKEEYRALHKTGILGSDGSSLIPCFEASPHAVERIIYRSKDGVRALHKAMGGDGSHNIVVIFDTDQCPEVSGIHLRHVPYLREAKFRPGTHVNVIGKY